MTAFLSRETDWPRHHAFISCSGGSADYEIVAADATHVIRVLKYYMIGDIAGTVRWESAAGGTALSGVLTLPNNGGLVLPDDGYGWFETTAVNQALSLEVVTSTLVGGNIVYQLVEPNIT